MKLNAYLHFNGDCEQAFKFYEKCLGGKLTMMPHRGSPAEAMSPGMARQDLACPAGCRGRDPNGLRCPAPISTQAARLLRVDRAE